MDVTLAAALYESGLTLRQVAAVLDRTHPAVLFGLRAADIHRRSFNPRTGGACYRHELV